MKLLFSNTCNVKSLTSENHPPVESIFELLWKMPQRLSDRISMLDKTSTVSTIIEIVFEILDY